MSHYRKHDRNKGTTCLLLTNILLLLIGAGLVYLGVYNRSLLPLTSELQNINVSFIFPYFGGIVLIVYSVLGCIAVCGGCMIHVYIILTILLSIVFAVLSIISCIFFFGIWFSTKSKVWNEVDSYIEEGINHLTPKQWTYLQDSLQCCGFKNQKKTASVCEPDTDCESYLYNRFYNVIYIATGVTVGFFIFLVFLDCASCSRMKALRLSS